MTDLRTVAARLEGRGHDEAIDLVVAAARPDVERLSELIELVGAGVSDDPGSAGRALAACAAAADELDQVAAAARARYLWAQTAAMTGDLAGALVGIERSRDGFERAGLHGAALRTNLGRANVLHALGRSADALATCDGVIAGLSAGRVSDLDPHDALLLLAAAQQNRGLCLELAGRYPDALAAYALAESGYRRVDARRQLGEVLNDRGLLLLAMGRIAESTQALEAAARVAADGGLRSLHAAFLSSRAEAELAQGSYSDCLETLAQARAVLADIDSPVHEHDRSLVAGRAYEALNLWPEAATTYAEAARFFAGAGMALDEARARWGLARVGTASGEPGAAGELDAAVGLFRRAEHPQGLAAALLDRARSSHVAGRLDAARAAAGEALDLATTAGAPVESVRARLLLAALAGEAGDRSGAARHLDEARRSAREVGVAPLEIAVDQATGLHELAAGRLELARTVLTRAIEGIERLHGRLTHDAIAAMFLADKLDAHGALVDLELRDGDPVAALATVERARARVLTELAAGRMSGEVAGPTAALERELDAVYHELFAPADRDAERHALIRRRAVELEHQINAVHLDAIGAALPAAPSQLGRRAELPDLKVPVLSWYCLGADLVTFVADDLGVRATRSEGAVPIAEHLVGELAVHHDRMRSGGELAIRHAARLERACRATLHELYRVLVEPVAEWLPVTDTDDARLVVVPHGALHAVPVHALHDGERYLVESFVVSYAPNLDIASRLPRESTGRGRRALVAAIDDEFAPVTVAEARAVAQCFDDAVLLTGSAATADAATRLSAGADVVHLACHALYRDDNPMFSALRFADRWVGARELGALDLEGAIVTLSTCDSARGRAVGGDELLGLQRAVLGAGAATMVASLWSADDVTTAALMPRFYAELDAVGPAASLRAAQLDAATRSSHPYFWAPFAVIGAR